MLNRLFAVLVTQGKSEGTQKFTKEVETLDYVMQGLTEGKVIKYVLANTNV